MEVGQQVTIQSFKHNGSLHRTWSQGTIIELTQDCWVVVTYKTLVVESNMRIWQTREPAITFFYPNKWYNVIAMIRRNGITYYCNVASPSLYDGEAIKNIDYDLDVKKYPDGNIEILDQDEYELHSKLMKYSPDLDKVVHKALDELVEMAQSSSGVFDEALIREYYLKFLSLDRTRRND